MQYTASTYQLILSSSIMNIDSKPNRDCFFPFVTTKIRRALDPHINESPETSRRRGLKASGNLLLGFSGGLGSTVLLDTLSNIYFHASAGDNNDKGGKAHPRNKRVWEKAYICYVETSAAYPEVCRLNCCFDVQS